VDSLIDRLEQDSTSFFQKKIILLPNSFFKQWLSLEIAKRKGVVIEIRFVTLLEWMAISTDFLLPNPLEMFFLIYNALSNSEDPVVLSYLGENKQRLHELAQQLSSLFFKYGQWNAELPLLDWQAKILHKIFSQGKWRTPIQLTSLLTPSSIHCFGIDFLAAPFWEMLFKASSLSIYLFSPCVDFWTDICSDLERKKILQVLKKRNIKESIQQEWEGYLREAPPLLASWGKLGRETLKILDRFSLEIEENYSLIEG